MDYFSLLNLRKEPFSNSPDPAFFYRSRQHVDCLQKLELSLRTRRGLSVVVGEVGTGKTTLCRELIRRFADEPRIETHLILDPGFNDLRSFLRTVVQMMEGEAPPEGADEWQLKERIKSHLFQRGVDEDGIVAMIVDEGQKMPDFCMEAVREFLNYETNEYKLLQIVVFAQSEFASALDTHANFADRISLFHHLGPLDFTDTRAMIRYRIRQSSPEGRPPTLFTPLALWRIYRCSGGYPRKIVNLCHQSLLAMIIQNRKRAGRAIVKACDRRSISARVQGSRWLAGALTGGAVVLAAGIVVAAWLMSGGGVGEQTVERPPEPELVRIEPGAPKDRAAPEGAVRGGGRGAAPRLPKLSAPPLPPGPRLALLSPVPADAYLRPVRRGPDASSPAPPELLGVARLQSGETLSWLCVKIYGVFDGRVLRRLQRANRGMADPDSINVDSAIRFPAVPVDVSPPEQRVWWLSLGDAQTLQTALEWVRRISSRQDPLRIIPHRHPDGALAFAVLSWRYYYDERNAGREAARIRGEIRRAVALHSQWEDGTVFYADPYQGTGG